MTSFFQTQCTCITCNQESPLSDTAFLEELTEVGRASLPAPPHEADPGGEAAEQEEEEEEEEEGEESSCSVDEAALLATLKTVEAKSRN